MDNQLQSHHHGTPSLFCQQYLPGTLFLRIDIYKSLPTQVLLSTIVIIWVMFRQSHDWEFTCALFSVIYQKHILNVYILPFWFFLLFCLLCNFSWVLDIGLSLLMCLSRRVSHGQMYLHFYQLWVLVIVSVCCKMKLFW